MAKMLKNSPERAAYAQRRAEARDAARARSIAYFEALLTPRQALAWNGLSDDHAADVREWKACEAEYKRLHALADEAYARLGAAAGRMGQSRRTMDDFQAWILEGQE
jgi:hypothetical protein